MVEMLPHLVPLYCILHFICYSKSLTAFYCIKEKYIQ